MCPMKMCSWAVEGINHPPCTRHRCLIDVSPAVVVSVGFPLYTCVEQASQLVPGLFQDFSRLIVRTRMTRCIHGRSRLALPPPPAITRFLAEAAFFFSSKRAYSSSSVAPIAITSVFRVTCDVNPILISMSRRAPVEFLPSQKYPISRDRFNVFPVHDLDLSGQIDSWSV